MDINQLIDFFGRHPILVMALIAVVVMIIANEVRTFMAAGFQLPPAKAVFKYNREGAQFLDLRPLKDFEQARVPGALSLPLGELESSLGSLGKFKGKAALILYSQAGLEVASSRKLLMRNGFDTVYELQGGFEAWKAQNFPVETAKRSKK